MAFNVSVQKSKCELLSIKDFIRKLLKQFNIATFRSHDFLRRNRENAKTTPKQQTRVAPVGKSKLKDNTNPDKLVTELTRAPIKI